MDKVSSISKLWSALVVVFSLVACTSQQELILPNKDQRMASVETYKQCVSLATNKGLHQNRDPEAIVRDSMHRCRTSKHAMLKDYPKGWRENFEQQVDEEILKEEIAYVVRAWQGQVR